MHEPFFQTQLARLMDTWGQNHFSRERANMIWKICHSLEEFQFQKMVDGFISHSKHAPLPGDFAKVFFDIRREQYTSDPMRWEESVISRPVDCLDCYETGWVFCKREGQDDTFMIYCDCRYGKKEEQSSENSVIPTWTIVSRSGKVFHKIPFPVRSFIPNTDERKKLLSTGMSDIVDRWVRKKAESKSYWQTLFDKTISDINSKSMNEGAI